MGIFNDKNINDKKALFIGKVTSTNKMTLIDKEEITVGDYNTAKVLNASFSNIASNLYPFATMGVVKGATKS